MNRIVVFGAGGRAGRAIVDEARTRGHHVTAVVRNPAGHHDAVAGDITDADSVARLAAGHDAVVNAAADLSADPAAFFPDAARALLDGARRAGVARLVAVGLASNLDTADGVPLLDTPEHPQEYRAFCLGHAEGLVVLRESPADWVVLSPAGDFDGTRTGGYRQAPADMASRISYADFATAVVDEIETPKHHRTHIGVETS